MNKTMLKIMTGISELKPVAGTVTIMVDGKEHLVSLQGESLEITGEYAPKLSEALKKLGICDLALIAKDGEKRTYRIK